MRTLPLNSWRNAIKDDIKAGVQADFAGLGWTLPKIIQCDDHWLRRIEALQEKLPAFLIALADGETLPDSDRASAVNGRETATIYDVLWLAAGDKLSDMTEDATLITEWLWERFSRDEDDDIPGWTPVNGVLVRQFAPVRFASFNELLELGIYGTRVTVRIDSSHWQVD